MSDGMEDHIPLNVQIAQVAELLDAIQKQVGEPRADPLPIDMVLHCPACGLQHVDAPDTNYDPHYEGHMIWENPPHRSHLCAGCGHVWRPADVPTNGVAAVKTHGKADSPIRHPVRIAWDLGTELRLEPGQPEQTR